MNKTSKSAAIEAVKFVCDLKNVYRVTPQIPKITGIIDISRYENVKYAFSDTNNNLLKSAGIQGEVLYQRGSNAQRCTYIVPYGNFYAIPSTSENPAALAAILNDMFSYNNVDSKKFVNVYEFKKTDEFKYRISDYREFAYKEFSFSMETIIGKGLSSNKNGLGSIIKPIFEKLTTEVLTENAIEQLIQEYEGPAQSLLDGTMNPVIPLD